MYRTSLALLLGGTGSYVAYLVWRRRQARTAIDPEAAFPTAALVCAFRAEDAKSDKPEIGRNIGGGPDLLASTFAGELGVQFGRDFAAVMGGTLEQMGPGIAPRTQHYDRKIMDAIDSGCTQLVILAAGLDARAWRLPRLSNVTVYEVDVPRSHAFKRERIAKLPSDLATPACRRVAVEADLSKPTWKQTLLEAGFDPQQRSFFLAEGLLMYLPPGAPSALFDGVASLMSEGSALCGCTFLDCLQPWMNMYGDVLAKYGTCWTSEFESEAQLRGTLADAGLRLQEVTMNGRKEMRSERQAAEVAKDEEPVDEEKAARDADKLLEIVATMPAWPAFALHWVRTQLDTLGVDKGGHAVVKTIIADHQNHQGWKDDGDAHKARTLQLALERGAIAKVQEAFADAVKVGATKSGMASANNGYAFFMATK